MINKSFSKTYYIILLFVAAFFMSIVQSYGQDLAIKYEADSTLEKGDTALIKLKGDIRGEIQWQESYAKEEWQDIKGENTNELLRKINDTTFFRAKITEESCEKPLYSEVVKINVMKLSPKTIIIDTTKTYLVSDTSEVENEIYKYLGDTDLGVTENSVIVGYKYNGYVKIVDDFSYLGDTLILNTHSGRLSDVFEYYNVEDSIHLLLSDEDVKKSETKGKVIKGEVDIQREGISLKKKGSGFEFNNLVLFDGTVENTDLKITIKEGELNFKPAFIDHFDITPLRIKYIYLTAHGDLDMNFDIEVEASEEIVYSDAITLKSISYPFMIGPVPVNIKISFTAGFETGVSVSSVFTTGFETSQYLDFGARYDDDANPQWKSIWNKGGTFEEKQLEMSNESGEVNAKVYVEPAISFNVGWDPFSKKKEEESEQEDNSEKEPTKADTTIQDKFIELGPYLAVSPYLRYSGIIDADGWEYGIYGGVEGKIGFDVSFVGYNVADFNTTLAQWEKDIITGTSPVADFSSDSTNISPGSTVHFTDESTGDPESWLWDFGDGETSTVQDPSHTYNSDGVYDVSLAVGGSYGSNTEKKKNYISVLETGTFTDTRDGQEYEWVRIGDQVWMAENLKYLPSVVGPSTGSDTDPYYYVYGYDGTSVNEAKATENYDTYGVIYNWSAVMDGASSSNSNPSGVQGICPDGWHVPSDEEWEELAEYISNDNGGYTQEEYGWRQVGGHLKATSRWNSGGNGTDDYGFSGLPGGYRKIWNYFDGISGGGTWWSATECNTGSAQYRHLVYSYEVFYRDGYPKATGFSVRCLRD